MENSCRENSHQVAESNNDDTDHPEYTLREKLIAAQRTSGFDSMQPFLTGGQLSYLIGKPDQKSEIEGELQRHGVDTTAEVIVGFAMFRARKIFATLVYSQLTAKIRDFFNHDFDDGQLPIEFDIRTGIIKRRPPVQRKYADTFRSWKPVEIREFCDNQWRFNSPLLDGNLRPEIPWFPPQTILPFNVVGKTKGTAFSKVWKIQPVSGATLLNGVFALKELTRDIDHVTQQTEASEDHLTEIKQLKKISNDSTTKACALYFMFADHIIELKGAFQRGNTLYMLLPWADGGSLYDLWYGDLPHELKIGWVRDQIAALVGALSLLHAVNCRHGDLKPDNILVFKRKNPSGSWIDWYLVISDFGLARVHEHWTRSRNQPTKTMTGAQRYEPPQVSLYHPDRDKPWSRSYDIWSLGCIFLEFIVWAHYGKDALEQFNKDLGPRREEKFWKCGSDGYEVHPVIIHWIEWMQRDLAKDDPELGQSYLSKLLIKVKTRMLIIETTGEEDNPESYRTKAWDLFLELVRDGLAGDWKKNLANLTGLDSDAYEDGELASMVYGLYNVPGI